LQPALTAGMSKSPGLLTQYYKLTIG
jgi:hypothetical protein